MWCEKCQADVAAQASLDNQHLHCTACGNELAIPAASAKAAQPARDPRELLARWAQEDALDPFGPLLTTPWEPASRPSPPLTTASEQTPERTEPQLRFDSPHQVGGAAVHAGPWRHAAALWQEKTGPHFGPLPATRPDESARWVALVGQMFAYLGVGTLTIGAVLVLIGYFGGPASYAPTGWLVTTAGQMLLFLGVVTLISGGMEQTTQEVTRRIDTLGDRLIRIEQVAVQSLARDPHFATDEAAATLSPEQQIRDQIAQLTRQLEQFRS